MFYPLCFQCHEISSLWVSLTWSILLTSPPLGHLHPVHYTILLIYVDKHIFTKVFWVCAPAGLFLLEFCRGSIQIPLASSVISNYFFTVLLPLLANSFLLIRFCKLSCGFISGGKEATQSHALLSMRKLRPVTNILKCHERSLMMMFTCYCTLWTEEPEAVHTVSSYSQLMDHGNGLVFFNWTLVTGICAYWMCKRGMPRFH